jgi:site-specific DNA-methyltransferase (adenine-specific)
VTFVVHNGDCRDVMATLDAASVDAVVCDPPYGLSFMGKGWDHGVPGEEFWTEALRVAKPGAHLLAFGGTRTYHRLACAIEDAGWEIRDCVMWVYGSGFPKSHDVSKAIDKAAGAEREEIGPRVYAGGHVQNHSGAAHGGSYCGFDHSGTTMQDAPATDAARQWSGWGTALKPAWEPIIVARKPLCGTVAENVIAHGTGGMNVDACRVGTSAADALAMGRCNTPGSGRFGSETRGSIYGGGNGTSPPNTALDTTLGRWPANLIHDGSDEVVGLFPERDGGAFPAARGPQTIYGNGKGLPAAVGTPPRQMNDAGSAARFFYCAKASKADRDEGCEGLEERARKAYSGAVTSDPRMDHEQQRLPSRNHHPTVKPTALMRYLCRLVTPPGGVVLDPFTGSGSTGKAAVLEGFGFVGIEREAEYVEIARARIAAAAGQRSLLEATA